MILNPLLAFFPPSRRTDRCSACAAGIDDWRDSDKPAVIFMPSQNLYLCRDHVMEAANELAQAAERLLELAR